ncbi:MAG TPA: metalloregulator ArsR/SmtB family transcription factor [Nocardioides sp.]|nr:metalloregulator ArsR/SmtB family transcription factor [Nocardioides sp.]
MTTYATDPWTALGDPSRRRILEYVAARPRSVSELAAELPISRPAVSQHLRVLRDARLVSVRAEGTRRIHHVDPEGLRRLRTELDAFWGQALLNFKEIAEEENQP